MSDRTYIYSKRAEQDIIKIYRDTAQKWGVAQADRYDEGLEKAVDILADNPDLGRECSEIQQNLRRFEHEKHIIFYRKRKQATFIVRILHQRMDAIRHL